MYLLFQITQVNSVVNGSFTSEFYRESDAFTQPKKQLLKRIVLEVKAIAPWLILSKSYKPTFLVYFLMSLDGPFGMHVLPFCSNILGVIAKKYLWHRALYFLRRMKWGKSKILTITL